MLIFNHIIADQEDLDEVASTIRWDKENGMSGNGQALSSYVFDKLADELEIEVFVIDTDDHKVGINVSLPEGDAVVPYVVDHGAFDAEEAAKALLQVVNETI